jgi:hypothetical protein
MALAGAGSAAKPASGVTTARAAAIHAGPGGVRQIGVRNYAGPNCPGAGWNCTTATRVLQIATAGGTNVGVCTGGSVVVSGPSQTCTISQLGGSSNTAKCTESSSDPAAVQSCDITQTGAANYAFVNQSIQSDGATHDGKQTANVNQGTLAAGSSVANEVHVNQSISQSSKTDGTQTQDAHQASVVMQFAGGAAYNLSQVNQAQQQKAYRGTIQSQDSANDTSAHCDFGFPSAPNECASVSQVADTGTNQNHFVQSINQDANTAAANATQIQGYFNGGIMGRVHQETTFNGPGSSQNGVNENKNQHMSAPADAIQSQTDPVSCCGFASQLGGSGNTENIDQSSSLAATGANADQASFLQGTSHSPDGSCTISQKAKINIDNTNTSDTESPCPFLTLSSFCTSGGGDAATQQEIGPGCESLPPDLNPPPECFECNFDGPLLAVLPRG